MIPLGILACICVTSAAIWWSRQAWVMLVVLVLVVAMAEVRSLPVRLEITESVVRARQGGWRGQPDKEVSRNDIRSIHYFPMMISFRGPDNTPIMKTEPHWTLRQMLKVAGELKVPLYDHTRWYGTREAHMGQLAYDPASGPVARNR